MALGIVRLDIGFGLVGSTPVGEAGRRLRQVIVNGLGDLGFGLVINPLANCFSLRWLRLLRSKQTPQSWGFGFSQFRLVNSPKLFEYIFFDLGFGIWFVGLALENAFCNVWSTPLVSFADFVCKNVPNHGDSHFAVSKRNFGLSFGYLEWIFKRYLDCE